jgi:hypothetical protein
MANVPDSPYENPLIAEFQAAGVDPAMLASAAETARVLCAQSEPVEGTCLEPLHYLDFQHLFQELAAKTRS